MISLLSVYYCRRHVTLWRGSLYFSISQVSNQSGTNLVYIFASVLSVFVLYNVQIYYATTTTTTKVGFIVYLQNPFCKALEGRFYMMGR